MFRRFATPATTAAVSAAAVRFGSTAATPINQEAIVSKISARGIFKDDRIKAATEEYLALGFDKSYASAYDTDVIAEHVYGFICAQAESAAGVGFSHSAISSSTDGASSAFFFCTNDKQIEVTKKIEDFVTAQKQLVRTNAVSVRSYHSKDNNTVLFTVEFTPFKNASPAKAIADANGPQLGCVHRQVPQPPLR